MLRRQKFITAALFSSLFTLASEAALLEYEASTNKIEDVTLSTSAKISGTQESLTQTGAGIRKKKIVFVKVDVYVAELFMSSPQQFKTSDATPTSKVSGQKAIALQLHMLRDLGADKMKSAFVENLKKNKIDPNSEVVQEFFKILDDIKEVKKGQKLTILGQKTSETEDKVEVESASGKVYEIKKPTGMIKILFSIWLGEPSDDELAELKKDLLKSVN